jgi:hypothetical protein
MGGVVLSDHAGGSENVAFEAVPQGPADRRWIPIPLGLVQFVVDPPEFNSNASSYKAFEIANFFLHPPLNIEIAPSAPSDDIALYEARNSLQVNLGDLRRLIPKDDITVFESIHTGWIQRIGETTYGITVIAEIANRFMLDPALQAALGEAAPSQPKTTYGLSDHGRAQAALSFELERSAQVYRRGADPHADPRRDGSTALFVGARAKYLRGVALASADGGATGTTGEEILSENSNVALAADGYIRSSRTLFGGSGGGVDVGVAGFVHGVELGVGVNGVGSSMRWKTDVNRYMFSAEVDSFIHARPVQNEGYTSHLPATETITAAIRPGTRTFALPAQRGVGRWTVQAGAEQMLTPLLALRAGWSLDSVGKVQHSIGAGVRLGPVGVDAGLASTSLTVTRERALEIALGLVLY